MRFETTAENRKTVVQAISELTGTRSTYMGPPTFAYQIGAFVVDRDGFVETEHEEEGVKILQGLMERGLAREEPGVDIVEVNVPLDGMGSANLANLIFLIHSKQYLMNRSLGAEIFEIPKTLVDALAGAEMEDTDTFYSFFHQYGQDCKGIAFADQNAAFPFPMELGGEKLRAFTELAAMMVKHAREKKRINHKETIEENEKYYMRVWLLRLGFGGAGGKETRKVLLADLKGHSAFRTEEEVERAKIRNMQRTEAAKCREIETP